MLRLWGNVLALIVFVIAALLEVGGDAAMRQNVKGKSAWFLLLGFGLLSAYGYLVNHVRWDFSKLLGVYVAVFAWIGVLWGRRLYGDVVMPATWIGLGFIAIGGTIIQFAEQLTAMFKRL